MDDGHSSNYRNTSSTALLMLTCRQQVLLEITAQLRETFNSEAVATLSPAVILILCKACWATVHLLRQNMEQVQPRVFDFCRCLLSLFCILGEAEGELKSLSSQIVIPG
jgi:hypothetical protein